MQVSRNWSSWVYDWKNTGMEAYIPIRHMLITLTSLLSFGCDKDSTQETGLVFTPTNENAPIEFEIRLGDDHPGEETTEVIVPLANIKCFVSSTAEFTNRDIVRSRLIQENKGWSIEGVLSQTAADKMKLLTTNNKGKRFVVMARGKTVTAPLILVPIADKFVFDAPFSYEEATDIAKAMVGQ